MQAHTKIVNFPTLCSRCIILTAALLLFIQLASCTSPKLRLEQPLNSGWVLSDASGQYSLSARVPGCVHTDLLHHGLIPDPFQATHEAELQWIGTRVWDYRLQFDAGFDVAGFQRTDLIFDGLDTEADIWLNDSLLGRAGNMFRTWRFDVGAMLREKNNRLHIRFYPPDSMQEIRHSKLPFLLPEKRAFSRKAPFQSGWDWGPTYITMGIWKEVRLEAWNSIRINNYTIHQQHVDEQTARLALELEIESVSNTGGRIVLQLSCQEALSFDVPEGNGARILRFPFEINNPRLWWPNGMGEQFLYDVSLELFVKREKIDTKKHRLGLRSIELVRQADSIGESFFFNVNGIPMYAKGANYIPADHFVHRQNRQKTRQLLVDAQEVHMNMIRVWGGGVYPDDAFYELCDSLGLLVWQDFMFACTMYPFDDEFLANVKQEAVDQVKRLRKHTSLALWCGNNEVDEGFHNWGWQKSLAWSDADSAAIWQGYLALFEELLPEVVSDLDPRRPYWPSSPSTGWGRPESLLHGDVHYWGVWWGEEPFEKYREKVGRFNSEFGFQAMPSMASLRRYISPEGLYPGSKELEAHQKHPRGTKLIHDYMHRDFPVPTQLDEYVFMSQLVQAYGIGMAIEAQRRSRPHSMGSLYWQLNDSWPVTSWSSIDYFGTWKALHYRLKELYDNILFSIGQDKGRNHLWITSDLSSELDGELSLNIFRLDGQMLAEHRMSINVPSGASFPVLELDSLMLVAGAKADNCCVQVELVANGSIQARRLLWLTRPRDLKLLPAGLQVKLAQQDGETWLNVTTKQPARQVALSSMNADIRFSDNFFDLLPGEDKMVRLSFPPHIKIADIDIKAVCLNDFLQK